MAEQEYWSEEQVIEHLLSTKAAIEEGLANLGVEDDVAGFSFAAMTNFRLAAPLAPPAMVERLGPRFSPSIPTDQFASNGHCGLIC